MQGEENLIIWIIKILVFIVDWVKRNDLRKIRRILGSLSQK